MIRKLMTFGIVAVLACSFSADVAFGADPSPVPGPQGEAGAPRLPVPRLETLPNGLTLAWFLNDSLPVVDLALLVQAGYRDDPAGKSGTAELVSSLLDRGAGGLSERQLAEAVEKLGATRFASTEEDTFSIGMHGLAPDAGRLLELLAKMALHPDFPESEVARTRDRLIDRWSHVPDYAENLANLLYRREIAAGTPYMRGSVFSGKELRGITRTDVENFHRTLFTPRRSVLMVVGRVDEPEFRKEVLKHFGPASWGEAPKSTKPAATQPVPLVDTRLPKWKPGVVYLVDRPGQTQAQVRIGFRAPPILSPDHYPLSVANALLGEYFNSRLNLLIRDQLGLTYGIGSAFSYSRDFADFTISAATRNETAGALIARTLEVMHKLRTQPIPADEVAMAKEYLEGGFPLQTSTLGSVAARWLAGYVFQLGPEYLNEFVPRVHAVTAEQVMAAVAKDLNEERALLIVAGEGKTIEKSLKEAGIRSVVRVDVKQLM
jgi:zinc protease